MNSPTTVSVNGPAVREIRVRSGMGVAALATAAGISRSYAAKIELGLGRQVSPQVFASLLSALSVKDRRAILAHPYGDTADPGETE